MKKTQFIPGAVEAMAEHAVAQYQHLLCDFATFQVDDEYLDECIEELVPFDIRIAAGPRMGCRPLLESGGIPEDALTAIIARLDAVERWLNKGNEFDMWCDFDEATGEITFPDDEDDE